MHLIMAIQSLAKPYLTSQFHNFDQKQASHLNPTSQDKTQDFELQF